MVARHGASAFLRSASKVQLWASSASCVSNHQTRTILLHAWSLPQDGQAFTGKQDATISQSYLREQNRELPEEVIYCWMLQSPGSLDREKKCVGVKEQLPLPHLLQDFHAKTRATSTLFLHGAGIGAGFPRLQLGFGVGAGCGIGIGFGCGFGKGVAYDESGRLSNVKRPFRNSRNLPYEERFDVLLDELRENTRKLTKAASKEIDKWRRM